MSNFVAELKRRNAFRVATAYALVAWIIIEAGSVLLPTFGATERTFQIYVIVVIVGFFLALLAWVFDFTSEGIRFDPDTAQSAEQSAKTKKILNYLVIGLLITALIASLTFNVAEFDDDAPLTAFAATAPHNSIAVLPFTSRSTDPENALFADGIHDDLLTMLANGSELKVISRTSVLEYRDTTKNLRQIGEELRVDTLLEGAVQKAGENVRINVQLIDARTDAHLWASTYDRKLTMQNIFSIQSEIAEAITVALKATLLPVEKDEAADIPTDDIRAYSLYVAGRDNLYLRRYETTLEARKQFEQAITLDSGYADAYVGLAESILLLHINHVAVPRDEAFSLAQENLDIALALEPELASAYATLGLLKASVWAETRVGDDNLEAEAAFERAISLGPNNADAYKWFASLRSSEQRFEEAIAYYHKSLQLDPLGRIPLSNLPTLYAQLGQNEVALKLWLDAVEIHPEWPTPYQYIAIHLMRLGRADEALAWSRTAQALSTDQQGNIDIAVYLRFGETEKIRELLEAMSDTNPIAAFAPGMQKLFEGDYNGALEYFSSEIEKDSQQAKYFLPVAIDTAILAGDHARARRYLLMQAPLLDTDGPPPVDRLTVRNIVRLAYLDRMINGKTAESEQLLTAALGVLEGMPRLGMHGYGLLDVQIHALQGRTDDAFAALNEAVKAGFRASIYFENWLLEVDPFLESIRTDPRFEQVLRELETLNEVMHQRVLEAERTGNWDQLRELALGKG